MTKAAEIRATDLLSTDQLWRIRGNLLEAGVPASAPAIRVLGQFAAYLDELQASLTSRAYSRIASRMEIGALGGVVLEQLLERGEAEELAIRLLGGAASEGLAVLASRQQIRAWEQELSAVHRRAAWRLFDELWLWAEERKPELAPAERRALIERLLAPVHAERPSIEQKTTLTGLLYQMLLLSHLPDDLPSSETP